MFLAPTIGTGTTDFVDWVFAGAWASFASNSLSVFMSSTVRAFWIFPLAAPTMSAVADSGAVGLRRWRFDGAYPRVGGESRRCSRTVGDAVFGTAVRRVSESRRRCTGYLDRGSEGFPWVGEGDCLLDGRSVTRVSVMNTDDAGNIDPHVPIRGGPALNKASVKFEGVRRKCRVAPACSNSIWSWTCRSCSAFSSSVILLGRPLVAVPKLVPGLEVLLYCCKYESCLYLRSCSSWPVFSVVSADASTNGCLMSTNLTLD